MLSYNQPIKRRQFSTTLFLYKKILASSCQQKLKREKNPILWTIQGETKVDAGRLHCAYQANLIYVGTCKGASPLDNQLSTKLSLSAVTFLSNSQPLSSQQEISPPSPFSFSTQKPSSNATASKIRSLRPPLP